MALLNFISLFIVTPNYLIQTISIRVRLVDDFVVVAIDIFHHLNSIVAVYKQIPNTTQNVTFQVLDSNENSCELAHFVAG